MSGVQVGLAADPLQVAALGQLVGDGDRVGRLAAAVEVEDRVVDQLVGGPVEVGAAQSLDAVGDRVLGQQHAAEDGLLGVDVLRGNPLVAAGVRRRQSRTRSCSTPQETPAQLPVLNDAGTITCVIRVDQRPPTDSAIGDPGTRDRLTVGRSRRQASNQRLWTRLWTTCAQRPARLCTAGG